MLLDTIRLVLTRSPAKVHQLLELDDQQASNGTYLPDCPNPDQCNPFATTLWELRVLATHWHPTVCAWIAHHCKGEFKHLVSGSGSFTTPFFPESMSSNDIASYYKWTDGCGFNPGLEWVLAKSTKSKKWVPPLPSELETVLGDAMDVDVPNIANKLIDEAESRRLITERDRLEHQLVLYEVYVKSKKAKKTRK
jgi:hypothetical protein